MPSAKSKIEANLKRIRENVAAACGRANRADEAVTIVAVTKSASFEAVKCLVDLGHRDLGESRIQQLIERSADLERYLQRRGGGAKVSWHMVGHLQRNKVKAALEVARMIHSVDSLRLAEEIELRAEAAGSVAEVLVQVNCSAEPQKFGVAVGAARHLVELVTTLKHIRPVGLMTMAPASRNPEDARPGFVRLRELFEEIRHEGVGGEAFRHLSMGMSQDYIIAVEEGATLLRIGSAIFA